jgi:hypothetical protein
LDYDFGALLFPHFLGLILIVVLIVWMWILCGRPRPSISLPRPTFFAPTATTPLRGSDPIDDYFSSRTAVKIHSTN